MNELVLVVDDEKSIVNGIASLLEEEGYRFCSAKDGVEALEVFGAQHPHIVILDIMMPRKNGFQTCTEIRDIDKDVPILMLSAKGDIVDKSVGFKAGADDYLTKPFAKEELTLRIEALLRRSCRSADARPKGGKAVVRIGDIEIQLKRQRVTLRGEAVDLTPKEFLILSIMANRIGQVFTTQEIIEQVWGEEYVGEITSVAVFVRRIREKIEDDPSKPRYLTTVWRVGYRLDDPAGDDVDAPVREGER